MKILLMKIKIWNNMIMQVLKHLLKRRNKKEDHQINKIIIMKIKFWIIVVKLIERVKIV
jgi:hypothetical protein